MNDKNLIEIETGKNPFPSFVRSSAPNEETHPLSRQIVSTSRDVNNVLRSAGNVHNFVRMHYVDLVTGVYGIERLIAEILKDNSAVYPKGIENTEFRPVAIQTGMFATEIHAKVVEIFGTERYPFATIQAYICTFMTRKNSANHIGKIQLTNSEDCQRDCCKPRTKYYLIEEENWNKRGAGKTAPH